MFNKTGIQNFLIGTLSWLDHRINLFGRYRLSAEANPFSSMFTGLANKKSNISIKCQTVADLEHISRIPIDLRFQAPQRGTLCIEFDSLFELDKSKCKIAFQRLDTLPARQETFLIAETEDIAKSLRDLTKLTISVRSDFLSESSSSSEPAVRKDSFPKIACVVSALWGRTGSTSIFDAQTSYFLDRGYFVCRIFVEHWYKPLLSPKFISENFEHIQPHLHLIATRNKAAPNNSGRSSIGRTIAALADAELVDPDTTKWISELCDIVVVNHLAHIGFATKHFSAPIILESHDVMTDLYDLHGVPDFATNGPDDRDNRWQDEQEALALADHCVCFSEADCSAMLPHARSISIVRPYSKSPRRSALSWREILTANNVPSDVQQTDGYDLLLWGDWHGGNINSCRTFFENVYPLLEPHNLKIAIAGRLCDSIPKSIGQSKGVYSLGRVENLFDFMMHSKVMVIYDIGGSGISVKAMETLAAGRPFVSTSAGMRHIKLDSTDYHPSKSAQDLVEDILMLCWSDEERRKRQRIAAQLYKNNFSKERYNRAWDEIIEIVLPAQRSALQ